MRVFPSFVLSTVLLLSSCSTIQSNNYSSNDLNDVDKFNVETCVNLFKAENEAQRKLFEQIVEENNIDCSSYSEQINEALDESVPILYWILGAVLFGIIFLDGGTGGHEKCVTYDINGNPACGD